MNNLALHVFIWVMKMAIWVIGKTNDTYLKNGIEKYNDRLKHYTKLEFEEIKDVKPGQTIEETKKREADLIISKLKQEDILILMDEKGEMYDSISFSRYIEKLQVQANKNVIMLIGGAYGHHDIVRKRSNHMISLSKMTFSHQMIRLFLVEQIYRAFTIMRNEKYHNA